MHVDTEDQALWALTSEKEIEGTVMGMASDKYSGSDVFQSFFISFLVNNQERYTCSS